ncbi:MAG: AraC family transcriptional regulator [Emticicia sp.]|nr:AraC family transcriptional regulator [Emticicia sp.]
MSNANSYETLMQIVENYLWTRIQKLKIDFHPIERVTQIISENPNKFDVKKMANFACLSISQFERKFIHQTGITPKFYARINRFYHAYQIKDKNPNADWLSIALETGYYDSQHLVKILNNFQVLRHSRYSKHKRNRQKNFANRLKLLIFYLPSQIV